MWEYTRATSTAMACGHLSLRSVMQFYPKKTNSSIRGLLTSAETFLDLCIHVSLWQTSKEADNTGRTNEMGGREGSPRRASEAQRA